MKFGEDVKTIETTQNPSKLTDRIIGRYGGKHPGPLIIAIGGMHGNEPSGVMGLTSLFQKLEDEKPEFKGGIVGIVGNLSALKEQVRYHDQDLNRMWKYNQADLKLRPCDSCRERPEFDALNDLIGEILSRRKGEVIFIDLHTTSAQSAPFILIGDTMRNRNFVKNFPVPIILGLEEKLNGPLLSYINELGHISMGFEAGQHDAPESAVNQEIILWLMLERAGCVSRENIPDFEKLRRNLATQTRGVQHFYEVRYHHKIDESHDFLMRPGYRNFQPISQDEHLADSREGKITANQGGRIFMPLYQSQGNDGFFIVRKIARFWLSFSAFLRITGINKILPILPGVRKHPKIPNTLIMSTRTVRFFRLQIFHLMGYRKMRREGEMVLMVRRAYDLSPPPLDENKPFEVADE